MCTTNDDRFSLGRFLRCEGPASETENHQRPQPRQTTNTNTIDMLGYKTESDEDLDLIDEGRANSPNENEEVRLDDSKFMDDTKAFDEFKEESLVEY